VEIAALSESEKRVSEEKRVEEKILKKQIV
jgi:hypothetical protein